jgi:hypothetical protein
VLFCLNSEGTRNSSKWDSTIPAGGVVKVGGGNLQLGVDWVKTSSAAYPIIDTASDPLISSAQAYVIKFRYRFVPQDTTRLNANGVTIAAMIGQQPNQEFGNSPAINDTDFWMSEDGNTVNYGLGLNTSASQPFNSNWHTLKFVRTGQTYGGVSSLYVGNKLIVSSTANFGPPNNIWLGVSGSTLNLGTYSN